MQESKQAKEIILTKNPPNYSLTGESKIQLANGKKRRLDKIKVGDMVLGVDKETNKVVPCKVIKSDTLEDIKTYGSFNKYTFSDGQFIKIVADHKFYNTDKKVFEFINSCNTRDRFLKEDGSIVKLIEKKFYNRCVHHFEIDTTLHNYFANGFLVGTNDVNNFDFNKIDYKA